MAMQGFALDTKVPTATGWTTVENLEPGDKVLAPNGKGFEVTRVELGEAEVKTLGFTSGEPLTAAEGQRWMLSSNASRFSEFSAKKKAKSLGASAGKRTKALREQISILESLLDKHFEPGPLSRFAVDQRLDLSSLNNWCSKRKRKTGISYALSKGVYDLNRLIPDLLESRRNALALVTRESLYAPRTTAEMSETLFVTRSKTTYRNWATQPVEPLELPDAELPLDPYFLGSWLADGDSSQCIVTSDAQDINWLRGRWGGAKDLKETWSKPYKGEEAWRTRMDCSTGTSLTTLLRGIGVLNNKHIPAEYLRASHDQRLALFQGILDSDGTIDGRHGKAEICLSRRVLIDQVAELMRTLGILCNVTAHDAGYTTPEGKRVVTGERYRVPFTTEYPVFSLPRKADRLPETIQERYKQLYLDTADPTGTQLVKSIYLGEQKQFLVGDFIPTLSAD